MAEFDFKEDFQNRKVYIKIAGLRDMTRRSIRHGFFALGKDLKLTTNKDILRKPKSGRTYIRVDRAGRRRRHVASAPGETHANLTGKTRRSLSWQVYGFKSMEFGYGVSGPPAPDYAEALEFGGKNEPRPSLQNNINAVNRNSEIYFTERFGK